MFWTPHLQLVVNTFMGITILQCMPIPVLWADCGSVCAVIYMGILILRTL